VAMGPALTADPPSGRSERAPVRASQRASTRLLVVAIAGAVAGVLTGVFGSWDFAPSVGWDVAALLFLLSTWGVIFKMDAEQTASHATREDPSKHATRWIVLGAAVASLIGVGYLLVQASADKGADKWLTAGLGVLSVALSWLVVHTLFTLKYALQYCTDDARGIDFNQKEPPRYTDFAYLAFTIGMTFQVSDTDLSTHPIRATALRHALLSFLFGSLILAASVNLVATLASTPSH
jgi:uncharacterized membrane protein